MESQRPHPIPCADSPSPAAQLGSDTGSELIAGCTLKALIVGLLAVLCLAFGSPYNDMIVQGTPLARWSSTPAAIFLFFVLVALLNTIVGLIQRRWALRRGELAAVYFLLVLANTMAGGFAGYVLPVSAGAYYYATPENNWHEIVHPYLPDWIAPQNSEVIWSFFEGDPSGVPWETWTIPLLSWLTFALAMFLTMFCLMVVVRRQWVEHERLPYPMAQLPLAMIADGGRGHLVRPLFRNPFMWVGFAFPFILGSIAALHSYSAIFPLIYLSFGNILIVRDVDVNFFIYPSLVGFSYFIPQNVGLGLWAFHVLNQFQRGAFGLLGVYGREEALGQYAAYTDPIIMHQAMGAMIVLVLGMFWTGRGHLKGVLRKAFFQDPQVDDSDEVVSYRVAVFGLLIGGAAMSFCLWRTGLPLLAIPVLLFGAFVVLLTFTREAVQGGVASMYAPMMAPDFVISAIGSSVLGPTGLAGLALAYPWTVGRTTMMVMMVACANGLKVVTEVNLAHRRRLFGAVVATIVLTLTCTVSFNLYLSYEHGGVNLYPYYFNAAPKYPFEFMAKNIYDPTGPNLSGWLYKGIGAGAMAALMVARHRFHWWPIHPLGFPISSAFSQMWFSVFLAWLLKILILKYGGLSVYNRLKPLFLGLILGALVVAGFWAVVDHFTGMTNNPISVVF